MCKHPMLTEAVTAVRQGCQWKQWIWKGTLLHSMPMRRGKPSEMAAPLERWDGIDYRGVRKLKGLGIMKTNG